MSVEHENSMNNSKSPHVASKVDFFYRRPDVSSNVNPPEPVGLPKKVGKLTYSAIPLPVVRLGIDTVSQLYVKYNLTQTYTSPSFHTTRLQHYEIILKNAILIEVVMVSIGIERVICRKRNKEEKGDFEIHERKENKE